MATINSYKPSEAIRNKSAVSRQSPIFYEYETQASATSAIPVPEGYKPFGVFRAGLKKREGSANDYTVSFDGFVYSVVPTASWLTDNVDIWVVKV